MKRHRMYTADSIAAGVKTVAAIRQKVFPFGTSPQLGAPSPAPPTAAAAGAEQKPIEMMEGHCMSCPREEGGKFKKHIFQVEGQETMKNGAIRKYGKCPNGHAISHLVSGKSNAV